MGHGALIMKGQGGPVHFPYVVFHVCSAKTEEKSFSNSSPK